MEEVMSTLVTKEELREKCEAEGIDFSKVCVIVPRWAESEPKSPDTKSALVRCDTIIRDDGSAVYLDGMMSMDGTRVARDHMKRGAIAADGWSQYVADLTQLPA